jgi:hypothetical protein
MQIIKVSEIKKMKKSHHKHKEDVIEANPEAEEKELNQRLVKNRINFSLPKKLIKNCQSSNPKLTIIITKNKILRVFRYFSKKRQAK